MNIRNLFFLGSILLLLSCKNSKQQKEYNSVNIIKYINIAALLFQIGSFIINFTALSSLTFPL